MVDVFVTAAFARSMLYIRDLCLISNNLFLFFRIVRAFLIEEQKIVAKVLKAQQAAVKSSKGKP